MSLFADRRTRSKSRTKPQKAVRADIQGLRALAVIAVILDHLLGWPLGGFVGVDVFFVVSGFLITGLLLREYDRTGTISFKGFYRRRAKRILPASALVLVVTAGAAFLVFNTARASSTFWDAVWAFLFAANWNFAAAGTDYFQQGGAVSPLQHFWSLAVEEQFYFVWPWLMLAIFIVGAKSVRWDRRAARISVGIAIAAITVGSFVWATSETVNNPTYAYFSTLSRSWELGIGALLAVLTPLLSKIPSNARPVLGWVGLVGIIVSVFAINDTLPFPAPWALIPVLSAAVLIAGGTGGDQRFLWPISNPAASYIGDISYSLYLWHFPVIVLLGTALDITKPVNIAIVVATIAALSIYSYHLVENPIRKSSWLSGSARTKRNRGNAEPNLSYRVTALSALGVLTLALVAPLLVPPAPTTTAVPVAQALEPSDVPAEISVTPELDKLQSEILLSLQAAEWPELSPTMDDAIAGGQTVREIALCASLETAVDDAACTWGDPNATKTAILVGDSTSVTYTATLRAAVGDSSGWQVKSYGTFGCLFGEIADAPADDDCAIRNDQAVTAINAAKPDVVFVTNHYESRGAGENKMSDEARLAAVTAEVSKITGSATRVVFLAPPPQDVIIEECYSKVSTPAQCVGGIVAQYERTRASEVALAADIGAAYVDTHQWFCVQGQCPSFVGLTPMKRDRMHITPAYQELIAPAARELLLAEKIL